MTLKIARLNNKLITICAVILVLSGVGYVNLNNFFVHAEIAKGRQHNKELITSYDLHTSAQSVPLSPTSLSLPRLGIEKEVLLGRYAPSRKEWTLDDNHVFFMQNTPTLLLYGHATDLVFGKLAGVALDEPLKITTVQHKVYVYKYTSDEVVDYKDDAVIHAHYPNTVLLLTCLNEEYRRVLHFTFVGEEKN